MKSLDGIPFNLDGTVGDFIRNMDDNALTKFLQFHCSCAFCPSLMVCKIKQAGYTSTPKEACTEMWKKWLQGHNEEVRK